MFASPVVPNFHQWLAAEVEIERLAVRQASGDRDPTIDTQIARHVADATALEDTIRASRDSGAVVAMLKLRIAMYHARREHAPGEHPDWDMVESAFDSLKELSVVAAAEPVAIAEAVAAA